MRSGSASSGLASGATSPSARLLLPQQHRRRLRVLPRPLPAPHLRRRDRRQRAPRGARRGDVQHAPQPLRQRLALPVLAAADEATKRPSRAASRNVRRHDVVKEGAG
jgi:hypothetical protein